MNSTNLNLENARGWTKTAFNCLKRQCICKGCYYENFFTAKKMKCQCKFAVIKLIRKYGKPTNYRGPTIKE